MVDGQAEVLLAGHQEVAHVAQGLEPDDVGAEQALHDGVADMPREHGPVLGRRPRDVDEVLDAQSGRRSRISPGTSTAGSPAQHDQRSVGALDLRETRPATIRFTLT